MVTGLVATFLLLFMPSLAVADEARVTDARGDVYGSVPEGFEEVEPVGTWVNTDLRRTVVDHRARALVVKVRYVALARRASASIEYNAYLNTGPGTIDDISMTVDIRPSLRRTTVSLSDGFGDVSCPRASATVKPGKDRLTVRVPRSCLRDPAWIRYRGDAESWDKKDRLYLDYDNTSGSQATSGQQTERLYAG
jgi:hypothetical protein